MLPKKYRLTSKSDFQIIYDQGTKVRGEYGMLIGLKADLPHPRLGIVASKKIGNAVQRHSMTRKVRHAFIELIEELKLQSLAMKFQYVSFIEAEDFDKLKEEFKNQLKELSK
jgi:ribonuclease P protein component